VLAAYGCASRGRPAPTPTAASGARSFTATAYCTGTMTAAGTKVRAGIVAADPDVLPMGSVIALRALNSGHRGVYTVMDTGSAIRGRRIDIYIRSCREAIRFGRQPVEVTLLHPPRSR
jgi:3D (Asp-Asp-Asp) domain-containing protein